MSKITSSKGGNRPSREVMNFSMIDNVGFPCSRENRKLDKISKRAFRKVLKKDKPFVVKSGDRHLRKLLLKIENPYKKGD